MFTKTDKNRTPQGKKKREEYRRSIGRKYVEGCLTEQVNNITVNWPTATVAGLGEGGVAAKVKLTPTGFKAVRENGTEYGAKLRDAVESLENWPTPTVAEADKIGGRANFGQKGLNNHPAIRGEPERDKLQKDRKGSKSGLQDQTNLNTNGKNLVSLKLNPNWVEQLMGLPVGWTQIKTE